MARSQCDMAMMKVDATPRLLATYVDDQEGIGQVFLEKMFACTYMLVERPTTLAGERAYLPCPALLWEAVSERITMTGGTTSTNVEKDIL